ncbi:MAG: hypothetical protein AB7R40_25260 [Nitrospiraceae bacterium]
MLTTEQTAMIDDAIVTLTDAQGRTPSKNAVFAKVGGNRREVLEWLGQHPAFRGAIEAVEVETVPAPDLHQAVEAARQTVVTCTAVWTAAREAVEHAYQQVLTAVQWRQNDSMAIELKLIYQVEARQVAIQQACTRAKAAYEQACTRAGQAQQAVTRAEAALQAAEAAAREAAQRVYLAKHHGPLLARWDQASQELASAPDPAWRIILKQAFLAVDAEVREALSGMVAA